MYKCRIIHISLPLEYEFFDLIDCNAKCDFSYKTATNAHESRYGLANFCYTRCSDRSRSGEWCKSRPSLDSTMTDILTLASTNERCWDIMYADCYVIFRSILVLRFFVFIERARKCSCQPGSSWRWQPPWPAEIYTRLFIYTACAWLHHNVCKKSNIFIDFDWKNWVFVARQPRLSISFSPSL